MSAQQDFTQQRFNAAWSAMTAQMDEGQSAKLEAVRADVLRRVISQPLVESHDGDELVMGIKDVHVGKFTVDIVALLALVLSELTKVFTGAGSEVQILLSVAVFVASLIGTISRADESELSDEQMVYSCILTLYNQQKTEPKVITVEDVVKGVELLDGCNQLKKNIPAPIDVDAALKKLQASNCILCQGQKVKLIRMMTVDQA